MADCPVISITKAHTRRGQIGDRLPDRATSDGDDRVPTFFDGVVVGERLAGCDDPSRRIAYAIVEGRFSHHHASAQMFPHEQGSLVVWITDLLPDTLAEAARAMMDRGAEVMTRTLAD
jgi:hypothetical protein